MSSSQEILSALRRLEGNLTERFDRRFDEFRLEMNSRFDAIEARLERLETEYQMITAALRRIEDRLESHDRDRERLRAEVADLKARMSQLSDRVQSIETRLAED
jgi:predicted nuclease with TOPRIM domain